MSNGSFVTRTAFLPALSVQALFVFRKRAFLAGSPPTASIGLTSSNCAFPRHALSRNTPSATHSTESCMLPSVRCCLRRPPRSASVQTITFPPACASSTLRTVS